MATRDASKHEVILAAGGIVWRDAPRGRELVVVHRPRYDDWSLPKGKLDRGERWQQAALREVEEETGFEVRLGEFAGGCAYTTNRGPKVVLYWHMQLVGPARFAPHDPKEVDAHAWLTPDEAWARLTHERERRVLADGVGDNGLGRS